MWLIDNDYKFHFENNKYQISLKSGGDITVEKDPQFPSKYSFYTTATQIHFLNYMEVLKRIAVMDGLNAIRKSM